MSSCFTPVSLAAVRQDRAARGQMSRPNGFGARRVRVIPMADRGEFLAWWSSLLRRRLGGDVARIAQTFACTEQTGRNWLAEFACPTGPAVDLAMDLWFEDFAARHRGADPVRRAA